MIKNYSFILFFLSFFIGYINPTTTLAFTLTSSIKEASLVYGKLDKNEKLFLGSIEVIPNKTGEFFFALPQGATSPLQLTLYKKKQKKQLSFPIENRKWKEEVIHGLQKEKVKPSTKNTERIRKENALLKEARQTFTRQFFPSCFKEPVPNKKRISGPFGSRRILNGEVTNTHSGTDYAAPIGTSIYSPSDGVVALTHQNMFLSGKTLLINHGFGLYSSYSHLNKITVKEGDKLKQGQKIGEVGTTGRSTGPHLHYVINWYGIRVDPEQLIKDFPCSQQ